MTINLNTRLFQEYRANIARQRAPRAEVRNDGVAELHIYGMIGSSWWEEGITADSIKSKLAGFAGAKRLNIFINSPGGSVYEADAIYAQLERFKAEKVAYIDGIAASAASYIALAADRVVTAHHAKWLIHNASTLIFDSFTAAKLREFTDRTAGELDKYSSAIAAIYVAKTGKKSADVIAQMDKDEIMTAAEALEFGLTDSVATFDEDNASDDPAPDNKAAAGLVAAARARVHVHSFRAQQSKRRDSKTK